MKNVNVIIVGDTNTGKTTIMKIIEKALLNSGISVVTKNAEEQPEISAELLAKRTEAIIKRTSVVITEQQANRPLNEPISFEL